MANKKRLVYRDFRPAHRGEPGYSKTNRRMYSPSEKRSISRREFTKLATEVNIPIVKPTKSKATNPTPPLLKGESAGKDLGKSRLEAAKDIFAKKTGLVPEDSDVFWEQYNVIKHPEEYDEEEVDLVYDFLFDYDIEDIEYDFPYGPTPD